MGRLWKENSHSRYSLLPSVLRLTSDESAEILGQKPQKCQEIRLQFTGGMAPRCPKFEGRS